jgi:hypothetical protein
MTEVAEEKKIEVESPSRAMLIYIFYIYIF